MRLEPGEHPHRRYNPLTGDWVLVSPHRAKRPWQGQDLGPAETPGSAFDPTCVLCPGNTRAGGQVNPDYAGTYVFDNDFAALLPESPDRSKPVDTEPSHPLFRHQSADGVSRVICFSPDHSRSLPELSDSQVDELLQTQVRIVAELGVRYPWVQLFENRGEQMGCSQPHPHAQVWATSYLPGALARKDQLLR
ncbi:MAG: galactose-1-phosphate uridylyltransferase, partial [Proteobacteria bacterium]|nr:galactose-1-phosphate uridylyltransferase [Pseudomonadota bacterium]